MKSSGLFISTMLVIDTFLVSFYAGFNSRHVLIVDPSLPPLVSLPAKKAETHAGDKKPNEGKGSSEENVAGTKAKGKKAKGKKSGVEHSSGKTGAHEHKKTSTGKKPGSASGTAKQVPKKGSPDSSSP